MILDGYIYVSNGRKKGMEDNVCFTRSYYNCKYVSNGCPAKLKVKSIGSERKYYYTGKHVCDPSSKRKPKPNKDVPSNKDSSIDITESSVDKINRNDPVAIIEPPLKIKDNVLELKEKIQMLEEKCKMYEASLKLYKDLTVEQSVLIRDLRSCLPFTINNDSDRYLNFSCEDPVNI
jgi:hypothetical protein